MINCVKIGENAWEQADAQHFCEGQADFTLVPVNFSGGIYKFVL